MAKGLPFLLLRNSAILKPKNQNEDIWNSNGDVPTVGNTNSCFATHFWGCRSKKWRLSLRNWGCALCFHGLKLNDEVITYNTHCCWKLPWLKIMPKIYSFSMFFSFTLLPRPEKIRISFWHNNNTKPKQHCFRQAERPK